MRVIEFSGIPQNSEHLIKTQPTGIVGELIDEPTLVYNNGKPILGYFLLPQNLIQDLTKVSREVRMIKNHRTSGLQTQSVVMGVMPRHQTMNNRCRFTRQSKTEQKHFNVLLAALGYCSELYQKHFPENYAEAMQEISQVDKSWRYNDTPYLTINVNVNHAIRYHRDTGNFPLALSTVVIIKHNMSGGELACPELNCTLSQRNGALTLFTGRNLVHGVVPIKPNGPGAFRSSIVFYSMNDLKHCYPFAEEFERAKEVGTVKAKRMLDPTRKLLLAQQAEARLKSKLGEDGYNALIKRLKAKA